MFKQEFNQVIQSDFYPPAVQSYLSKIINDRSVPDYISYEGLILSRCSSVSDNSDQITEFLLQNLNWCYIVEKAIIHNLAPLLYYNLNEVNSLLPSQEVHDILKYSYNSILRQRLVGWKEFKEVLRCFEKDDIKIIALKGLSLAETIYPDPALRPTGDLDLLIEKKSLSKVRKKLSEIGFTQVCTFHSTEFVTEVGNSVPFYGKEDQIPIDIHWHIIKYPYSKYINIDEFWDTAVSKKANELEFLVLSPENQLINLCLHCAKHGYLHLLGFVDISEFIHTYSNNLDWELFLEKVNEYRIQEPIHQVLSIVKTTFNAPLPKFVLTELTASSSSSLEYRIFSILNNPKISRRKWDIAEFASINGVSTKLRYLVRRIFPEQDYMKAEYSNNLLIAYLLRFGDCISFIKKLCEVFLDGIKVLWRRLRSI